MLGFGGMKKLLIAVILIVLALSSCSGSSASTLESPREVLKIISESELNCVDADQLSGAVNGTLIPPNTETLICGGLEETAFVIVIGKSAVSLNQSLFPVCRELLNRGNPSDLNWDEEVVVGQNWFSFTEKVGDAELLSKVLSGTITNLESHCNQVIESVQSAKGADLIADKCNAVTDFSKGIEDEYSAWNYGQGKSLDELKSEWSQDIDEVFAEELEVLFTDSELTSLEIQNNARVVIDKIISELDSYMAIRNNPSRPNDTELIDNYEEYLNYLIADELLKPIKDAVYCIGLHGSNDEPIEDIISSIKY